MIDGELQEVLKSFKDALNYLNEENKALNDKIDELSNVLYNEILAPVNEAVEYSNNERQFIDFRDRNEGMWQDIISDYAVLNNGNDIARDIWDTYKEHSEEYSEEEFIAAAMDSIKDAIAKAKEALGIAPQEEVTVTEKDGEVAVIADTEVEEPSEEVVEENSPDEVAAFEKYLEKFKK